MKRQARYIAFEDKNLDFTPNEVAKFDSLIGERLDIPEIAKQLRRSKLETLLLYIDRVERRKVAPIHYFKRRVDLDD